MQACMHLAQHIYFANSLRFQNLHAYTELLAKLWLVYSIAAITTADGRMLIAMAVEVGSTCQVLPFGALSKYGSMCILMRTYISYVHTYIHRYMLCLIKSINNKIRKI